MKKLFLTLSLAFAIICGYSISQAADTPPVGVVNAKEGTPEALMQKGQEAMKAGQEAIQKGEEAQKAAQEAMDTQNKADVLKEEVKKELDEKKAETAKDKGIEIDLDKVGKPADAAKDAVKDAAKNAVKK